MLASLPLSSQTLAAKRGPPKVLTRQQRDATEDAVCKVHICGEEGSGVLVSWAGYTAVLTGDFLPGRVYSSVLIGSW